MSRGSLVRGDAYFAQGRVRRVQRLSDGTLRAEVQGTQLYTVTLRINEDELTTSCNCPWFAGQGDECKHIWAAIRAASAQRLLPERELFLAGDEDHEEDEYPAPLPRSVFRREPPRPWQRFLDAVGPALPPARETPRNLPEEVVYLLAGGLATALSIQLHGRTRRKNGDWGKWKPLSLNVEDLQLLPRFDQESIALLHQRSWGGRIDPIISIPASTSAWWVERLSRAGRLCVLDEAGDPIPIEWDDGTPWTLRVAIVSDPAEARYRITGAIEREDETLPFEDVDAILPGVVISDRRASRFDDNGRTSWLQALRANGIVEVPHADTERFRRALLRAPIANIQLPEELGWTVVDRRPQPLLALEHDASAELRGELFFLYDEWRVASRSEEQQTTIGNKLIRRNRQAEDTLRARLGAAGAIGTSGAYRIRLAYVEQLARELAAEKWLIEIDSSPVRISEELDVEISSGIDWFDLNVHASFGSVRLALPELLAAADARRSFLRLPDGSYGIVPVSWAESLAPVLEMGRRQGDAVRFRPAQALLIDALLQPKAPRIDDAFSDLRQRIADAAPTPRQEPATLTAALRPYQRAGLGWLYFLRDTGLGGCLADDMGLGKTVQTLALLEGLRAQGVDRPSLVVAPRSLLFNWAAEAKRFAPQLRVIEHHGSERARNEFANCDVVLTTYATMRLDIATLAETEFEYVILDEAQAIKNASSQVAKATRVLRARHRLALSGTPIENHLGELWSLFEFLDPGLLGSARSFSRMFASKSTPPERRDALARALRPLILRRTKEQVAPELPARTEQTLYCELEGKQKQLYEELRDHYRQALLGRVREGGVEKSRMQILEALLRLRQAACAPALIDPKTEAASAKVDLLMEELREVLDSGHRALVFSQFTSFLRIVEERVEKERISHLYLDGSTGDRQSLVERFQRPDGPPLFLISLKAGGLGLNLTNADYIFLLDPWWNPAVEAQAIDRAHRIGQTRPVVAYRLIARDTVEEKILELQARKRELADSIISQDNSVLRKLELQDLEMLLG